MNGFTRKIVLLLALSVLLASGSALAENRAGAVTLTPMVGYHVFDGGLGLDNGMAFGLALGYNATPHCSIEGDVRFTPSDSEGPGSVDVDVWTVSLGGLYHFNPTSAYNPYLTAGLGLVAYQVDGADDEDVYGYYGTGVKYSLNETTALRLDLRHLLDYRSDNGGSTDDDSSWRHHFQAMAGLTFQFGGR